MLDSRVQDVLKRVFSGHRQHERWKSTSVPKRLFEIFLDLVLAFGSFFNFPFRSPTFMLVIGVFSVIRNVGVSRTWTRPFWWFAEFVFFLILLNAADEYVMMIGLLLDQKPLVAGMLLVVLPPVAGTVLCFFNWTSRPLRLTMVLALGGAGLMANILVSVSAVVHSDPGQYRDVVTEVYEIPVTDQLFVRPRFMEIDPSGARMMVSYRHRYFTFEATGGETTPIPSMVLVDTIQNQAQAYSIDQAEVIAAAFSQTDTSLYLSLVRRHNTPPLPERSLARVGPEGTIQEQPIAGSSSDYRDTLRVQDDHLWMLGEDRLRRFDFNLREIYPGRGLRHARGLRGSYPTWTMSSGSNTVSGVYRTYFGAPLKGLFFHGNIGIDLIDPEYDRILAQRSMFPMGAELVVAGAGDVLVLEAFMGYRQAVWVLEPNLGYRKILPINLVARALAADFPRRRFAVADYLTGELQIRDLDTGAVLGEIPLGAGIQALAFAPDGRSLYAGSATHILKVHLDHVIPDGSSPP